jgi:[ribosomal protein S18]-alanine N-acetyltransferase
VSVRVATGADLDAVVASETDGFGADAWSPQLVGEGLAGRLPTVHYLVAEDDGAVVGHAVASVVDDLVELQRIAVATGRRRGGVGSALLEAVLALRPEGGRVLLEVREDNTGALGFYAARGFVELHRRPRYYRDGATAIVMELA